MTFVYDFDERCEGGRALLGGKGLGLAEMTQLGLPVPCGFTVTTEACRVATERGELPPVVLDEILDHVHRLEASDREAVRQRDEPASALGALGRPGLDAGHDGNSSQPRHESRDRPRRRPSDRGQAVRVRRLSPPACRCTDRLSPDIDGARFEQAIDRLKHDRGIELDSQLTASDFIELAGWFEEIFREETGVEFPTDPREQLVCAVQGRLRVVGRAARARLPARVPHSGRPRNRRERDGDGVREPRRALRDRGLLQPKPGDGRAGAVRRVPGRRAGRGRRRRHAHARADRTDGKTSSPTPTTSWSTRSMSSSGTTATCRTWSSPSSMTGSTCSRPAARSAPRPPHCARAVAFVDEGLISPQEAVRRIDPAAARAATASGDRSDRLARRRCRRSRRVARSGLRRRRLRRRRCRRARRRTGARDPGAAGDDRRRHPRPDRRRRCPDGARRHDVARRCRRSRHGQAVRRRLRRAARGRRDRDSAELGAVRILRGRRDHDRRHDRASRSSARSRSSIPSRTPTSSSSCGGPTRCVTSASAPTPTRRQDARRARGRTAPRASASAAPSTCSWRTTGCRSSAR